MNKTTPEVEAKQAAEAELRRDYALVFSGPRGEKVLEDLMRSFGVRKVGQYLIEQPSATPGMRNEEVWMREGMKQPLRHILAMMTTRETEQRPDKAISQ